jgi:hypothetical protein
MNKQLTVVVLALVLVLSLPIVYADIGENFAKGGVALSGSVSFYNNFYRVTDSTEERNFWSLDVSPGLDYYVADRVAVGVSPWLSYSSFTNGSDIKIKDLSFGFSAGGYYAFVPDPAAQKGLVVTLGGAVGLSFFPGVADLAAGVEVPDDSMETDLLLYLTPRLYFFLNDRLAPYVGLTPRLVYILSLKDDTGAKVDLTSQESLYARVTATVGISWFIPTSKASVFLSN